jgi:hypothetical protein
MLTALARAFSSIVVIVGPAAAQAAWTRIWPLGTLPAPRSYHAMTYDSVRGNALIFGGQQGSTLLNDLWRFDGTSWIQVPAAGPSPRFYHSLAFDSNRGRAVLFGGTVGSGFLDETWEWNGTAWLLRGSATRPAPRWQQAMAYDPSRQRIVLFGGDGSSLFGDLWEYDGNTWQQRQVPGGPGPRSGASLAFDTINSSMLLFGGGSSLTTYDETWSLNGSSWTQRFPTNPPYARRLGQMVTDSLRARVVLFGSAGDPLVSEWDGSQWHYQTVLGPAPRDTAMAYDSAQGQVLLFGGSGFQDTWAYRTSALARFTAYGSGCVGSNGTPVLANAPNSLPWIGDVFSTQATSLAATSGGVVFVTGLAATSPQSLLPFGLPGCSSLVTFDAAQFVVPTNGIASWSITVPVTTALANTHVYQQALALDNGATGGATTSNAGDILVGIR